MSSVDMQSATEEALKIIVEKLETSEKEKYCYIYKVYDHLRNLNKKAYEPEILAIGPYHHDAPNTKSMENHKLLYLKSFLKRKNESGIKTYLSAVEEMAEDASECYSHDHFDFKPVEFIKMMLLDGCFIIELLHKFEDRFLVEKNGTDLNLDNVNNPSGTDSDDIFDTEWMLGSIKRDLMLFENQIPFFVLNKLFELVKDPNRRSLSNLLFDFFGSIIPNKVGYEEINLEDTIIIHLLDFIYSSWIPSSPTSSQGTNSTEGGLTFITSATKLRDANVDFVTNGQEASLFHVKFENGTLKMTPLRIVDRTEALFRNLIAYEQYFPTESNFVTDYVKFLDCLIDSPQDVEILRENKILDNWLGTDTVVSDIFIKLTDSIFIPNSCSYVEVFDQVNEHCKKKRNKWKAMLRRNHCNSPWAILSIIAAVILLLLTTVQTVCSILQV